jgi:hypothetical protein
VSDFLLTKDDAIEALRLALKRLCDEVERARSVRDPLDNGWLMGRVREGYRVYHATDPARLPRQEG